ncbi:hypothetical protein CANINC_003533, partial [Pichia inconspicua]
KYAIIIDAGSSGSRAQVYEYRTDITLDPSGLPQIQQISNTKTKPGLSSFGLRKSGSYNLWDDHFESIIDDAAKIIPVNLHSSTPIYVQATAGMRLLPHKARERVLKETCQVLQHHSNFIVQPCEEHIEVIDGDTEGIYGWIALNYLTNRLNNEKIPYGFMDMGGASTQLAFTPSTSSEIEKHDEDMYTVSLRRNDGISKDYHVFVSSWLGFGANQARERQLDALVNALPPGVNYDVDGDGKDDLVDPCSPIGMKTDVLHNGKTYTVTGSGEYEGCLKTIYPLLLKHLPCKSEPCLFNGVHAPQIDFTKEKFVGVSEYWYTAHDVFKLTGEYNYEDFEKATSDFCKTSWDVIMEKYNNGEYGENLTLDLLEASCFKASWIVNVLHDGFGVPRLGVDEGPTDLKDEPVFKSVNTIEGNELSWCMGKMVLYASSQIEGSGDVGIVAGSAVFKFEDTIDPQYYDDINNSTPNILVVLAMILLLVSLSYYFLLRRFGSLQKMIHKFRSYGSSKTKMNMEMCDLEEGRSLSQMQSTNMLSNTLRTRSTANLNELTSDDIDDFASTPNTPKIDGLKQPFQFATFKNPSSFSTRFSSPKQTSPFGFRHGNGSQHSMF